MKLNIVLTIEWLAYLNGLSAHLIIINPALPLKLWQDQLVSFDHQIM